MKKSKLLSIGTLALALIGCKGEKPAEVNGLQKTKSEQTGFYSQIADKGIFSVYTEYGIVMERLGWTFKPGAGCFVRRGVFEDSPELLERKAELETMIHRHYEETKNN